MQAAYHETTGPAQAVLRVGELPDRMTAPGNVAVVIP